jgi:hypothetical protein
MKRFRPIFLLLSVYGVGALAAEQPNTLDRQLAGELAKELKSALAQALQVSPENAIAVCNERAPQIATKISKAHDVQIGRTALRVRNTANRPTAWQQEVLKDFERRAAAGEPIVSIEYSATVQQEGVTEHRYMKAIPTEPLCIVCHGQPLAPSLLQAIAAKYPADEATSFKVGDLRGAVYVVRHPVPRPPRD